MSLFRFSRGQGKKPIGSAITTYVPSYFNSEDRGNIEYSRVFLAWSAWPQLQLSIHG